MATAGAHYTGDSLSIGEIFRNVRVGEAFSLTSPARNV
jgi:hypothetical protein